MRSFFFTILLTLLISVHAPVISGAQNSVPVVRQWNVNGVTRAALVYVPPRAAELPQQKRPLLFAFHGHGGTMQNAATTFQYHAFWPEAIVVYMQGLPTPGALTDPTGQFNGWQRWAGDQQDRDLKFFDAVLASLKKEYPVDDRRIYAAGHSNGGSFTYLLWAERGDAFAALAPAAAVAGRDLPRMKPKPALHVAGENDRLVPFVAQQNTMEAVRKLNGCTGTGGLWARSGTLVGTLYPSPSGTPFVSLISPGGHEFPQEASPLIVKFFQGQSKAQIR